MELIYWKVPLVNGKLATMMGAKGLARSLLIIISVGIFCYQMHSSLNKLASQQLFDVTTTITLSDLDVKPLVTICLDYNNVPVEYLTGFTNKNFNQPYLRAVVSSFYFHI